jgi:hypothetical protein
MFLHEIGYRIGFDGFGIFGDSLAPGGEVGLVVELGLEVVDGGVVGSAEAGDGGVVVDGLSIELGVDALEMGDVEVGENNAFTFGAVGEVGEGLLSWGRGRAEGGIGGHVGGGSTEIGWRRERR